MMGDDPVQVCPQPINIGRLESFDPLCVLALAVVSPACSRLGLLLSSLRFQRLFVVLTNGFHRIVRIGLIAYGMFSVARS